MYTYCVVILLALVVSALVNADAVAKDLQDDTKAASCDVLVTSDSSVNGTVTSPGYPSPYPVRSHCRYDFQGRGKQRVQLVFNDFHLYHPSGDLQECEDVDVLMAYVLIDGRMEKIDNFCGTTLPRQIMSNGPRLMMEFRGVYSSRYAKGFKATYSFIENFGITTGHQLIDLPCAFEYNSTTAMSGSFSSPNFPGLYPRDTECHYFFYGQNQQRVQLHFHYFDVEGVFPCEAMSASDYIEFSNFMMTRDRKYPRHCGLLKQFEIESDRKFFRVTFKSNDRLDGTGFNATYHFVEDIDPTSSLKPALPNSVQSQCPEINHCLLIAEYCDCRCSESRRSIVSAMGAAVVLTLLLASL